MKTFSGLTLLACALLAGCHMPGKPAAEDTPQRPDQVSDFHTLYSSNCAACHGTNGKGGAAISLANPTYLAYAGEDNITRVTAQGIPGSLMPGFASTAGGLLTDSQIRILAHGMVAQWGHSGSAQASSLPPYTSQATGDAGRGEAAYKQSCLRCHAPGRGSLLDPAYLALISDGGLRSIVVSGKPEQGMPDWSGYGGAPLTDGQISDVVAFLAAHRTQTPGQPYTPGAKDKAASTGQPAAEKVSN